MKFASLFTTITVAGLSLGTAAVQGAVKTDGSVGPQRALAGPNFAIGANLGQQRGGNLFHSFSVLNLDRGESATFSGPASVTRIFARVTGDQASSIDGTLRSGIPNADFFLINPAGVIFGPNAALDVKGSFTVTTADYLKHGDGTRLYSTGSVSVLSSAAPAAFGFLGTHRPAGISLQGRSELDIIQGQTRPRLQPAPGK